MVSGVVRHNAAEKRGRQNCTMIHTKTISRVGLLDKFDESHQRIRECMKKQKTEKGTTDEQSLEQYKRNAAQEIGRENQTLQRQ